jgi:hypothetical protein
MKDAADVEAPAGGDRGGVRQGRVREREHIPAVSMPAETRSPTMTEVRRAPRTPGAPAPGGCRAESP